MQRYDWSKLTPSQIGRYGEYSAKFEFTRVGCNVYTPEVDDHGIDFVIGTENQRYFGVQVKAVYKSDYIFFLKSKFQLRSNLLASLVIFHDGDMPTHYLIRATAWKKSKPPLVDRKYKGKGQKSKPEWGLNLSKKNMPLLEEYMFDKSVASLALGKV